MKQKLSLFILALLTSMGAWATSYTITYGTATGTFYDGSGNAVTTGWIAKWVSNEAGKPVVTLTASANNINAENGRLAPGSSESCTYTLSVENGCVITGFTLNCPTSGAAVTITPTGETSTSVSTGETIVVNSSSSSFVYSGSNSGRILASAGDGGSFTITVEEPSDAQVAAYNTVQNWVTTIQSSQGLVTDAANYISNAKSSAEGSYAALLDGNYTTHFHSDYSGSAPDADHYLQATLSEPVDALYFYYKKRSQNNANRPTSITISGSNDGTSFTEVTTINSGLPTGASPIDYTSSKINLGASYQYIRFTVTQTSNMAAANGHVFFTFSEFYLLPSNSDVDNVMDLRATLVNTVAANYTAQNISDVTAANTALLNTIVNVTYALYESDGTTFVGNTVVEQTKNSAVSIPSAISAYTYYDYATEGTIGTEDCTIKVTRTLKSGYVIDLAGFSNDKCYNIRNNRATWAVGSGAIVVNSTDELELAFLASDTKQQFAFITYEGNVYLYSVSEGKFAYVDGTKLSLTADVTSAVEASPVTLQTSTNATYMYSEPIIVTVGGNHFGVSTGFSPDIYKYNSQGDGGNCAYIIEAGSFDATAALALLEEYFHPTNCYDRVEAEVIPFLMDGNGNPSPTIGKPFGLSSDAATSIVQTYMTQLNNQQFTLEEYNAIVAAKDAGIIYPEAGKFYHVKNVVSGKYLRATKLGAFGASEGAAMADGEENDAAAIVELRTIDGALHALSNGAFFNWTLSWSPYYPIVSTNKDRAIEFKLVAPGKGAFALYYDKASYPESSFYGVVSSTDFKVIGMASTDEKAQWTFEEVTEFSIPLNTVEGKSYATFCAPFDVTLGTGANAYKVELDEVNGKAVYSAITDNKVPAGAGVLIISDGAAASVEATINTTGTAFTALENNDLVGYYFSEAYTAEASSTKNLVLGVSSGSGIGFYQMNSTATASPNKAYLPYAYTANPVKGFVLVSDDDDATAIQTIDNGQQTTDASIFNLAGQRISKMQKGINIVNGKKILK